MIDALSDLLLAISHLLLVPDVLLLVVFLVATLVYLGGAIGEAVVRARDGAAFRAFVARLKSGEYARADAAVPLPKAPGLVAIALAAPRAQREKTLEDLELRAERALGRLHLGVRLGPVLGLAGTLIPLGPALVALSNGDLARLSDQLVVAFATPVLGLFIGGVCFALHSIKRRWYEQDLSDVEFVLAETSGA